jgi:hypothetical protein
VAFFDNVFAKGPTKYSFNIDDSCLKEFEELVSMGKKGIFSDAAYHVIKENK